MTRVLVAIPWRPQPHRETGHTHTVNRYRALLPEADLVDVDTDDETFCLAGCRNKAVALAETGGYDVVVIGDADTLPEPGPLHEAINAAAHDTHRVHLPYTQYRSLRADGTRQYLTGRRLADCNHLVVPFATSGVYVTTPAAWWHVGGQDERFKGWAPEDMAWLTAHRLLAGEPARHEGVVYALHHDSPPKTGPTYEAAVRLYQRYQRIAETGDLDALHALLTEPGRRTHYPTYSS